MDLTQEQDDCHVFASLQADIIKKQVELLKAAIARLTAFTGTLVNPNDAPAVVPAAATLPVIIPAAAVGNVAPVAAVGNVAPVAAVGIVAARKSKRVGPKKIRMNL